jgi:hypothetical protein
MISIAHVGGMYDVGHLQAINAYHPPVATHVDGEHAALGMHIQQQTITPGVPADLPGLRPTVPVDFQAMELQALAYSQMVHNFIVDASHVANQHIVDYSIPNPPTALDSLA